MCAKIIFSVPVSSAGIERLLSQAGMLLTKQRKENVAQGNEKVGLHPVLEKVQIVDGTFGSFCQ